MVWECLTGIPEPTGGFACGSLNGKLAVLGGTNWTGGNKNWLSSFWLYDPLRNAWSAGSALNHPLAYSAFGQRGQNEIWTAGGSTGSETVGKAAFFGEIPQSLDLTEATVYGGGGVIGNLLYLLGGAPGQDSVGGLTSSFWSYDLTTERYRKLPPYVGPCFGIGATVACGSRIFACGGAVQNRYTGLLESLDGVSAYSTISERWDILPSLARPTRGMAAVALDDRRVLVAGGFHNDFTADAFVYDLEMATCRAVAPLPYAAMVGLARVDDWIYCVGGEDAVKHRTNALFRARIENFA